MDPQGSLQLRDPSAVEAQLAHHVMAVAQVSDLVGEPALAPHGGLADVTAEAAHQRPHRFGRRPQRLVVEVWPDDVHELVVAHHARTYLSCGLNGARLGLAAEVA